MLSEHRRCPFPTQKAFPVPNKNGASLRLSEAAVLNPFLEGGEAFPPHRISTPPESLHRILYRFLFIRMRKNVAHKDFYWEIL